MGHLKINILDHFTPELARRIKAAGPKVAHELAIEIANDTDPFVPALTGQFADDTKVIGNKIIYPGARATFLYRGKLFIDPNTGSSWAPQGASKVITGKDLKYNRAMHSKAQSHWYKASEAQNLKKWERSAERMMVKEVAGK